MTRYSLICLLFALVFIIIPPVQAAITDLTGWKVTLPVDSGGNLGGSSAHELKPIPSTLYPPYFIRGTNGELIFSAPTNGATTGGSKYPRSELRELENGTEASWSLKNGGILSAEVAVNEIPTIISAPDRKSKVVIGQIHGPSDELCRLYYEDGGKLYFVDDKASPSEQETPFELKSSSGQITAIPLNERFSYMIDASSSELKVQVLHKGVLYSASEPISNFWKGSNGDQLYFKAGAYVQVNESQGTGKGTVTFYELYNSHHGGTNFFGSTSGGGGAGGGTTTSSSGGQTSSTSSTSTSSSSNSSSSGSSSSTSSSGSSSTSSSTSSGGGGVVGGGSVTTQLAIPYVSSSSYEVAKNNVAANSTDSSEKTYWAAAGEGQWIQLDLSSLHVIDKVTIKWHKGDIRSFTYSVEFSADGQSWTSVANRVSSNNQITSDIQANGQQARFIRITGYGNTRPGFEKWTSISDIKVFGSQ